MAIKVSSLLKHNTDVVLDTSPALGGPLNTNNYPIANGSNPVVISGNSYPITPGTSGQVLTTNGSGILSWQTPPSGSITLVGAITGSGSSPVTTTITPTGVISGTYGSTSSVGIFTVNAAGQITNAISGPISITPAQAGLGNVTNQLQVINAGGAPSVREGVGAPAGLDNIGAIYVDQAVTNGNAIYRFNGSTWDVIATRPNLYSEKVNGYTAPGTTSETATYQVDTYAYYNRTLSQPEIQTMYESYGNRHAISYGVIAAYDFDELAQGSTVTGVVDISGNGNTMLNTGAGTAITYTYTGTVASSNLRRVQ